VKDFLSYCRLVKGTVASAGKIKGLRGELYTLLPRIKRKQPERAGKSRIESGGGL